MAGEEKYYLSTVIVVNLPRSLTIYAAEVTYSSPINFDIIGCHGDVLSFKVQHIVINLSCEVA